MKKIILTVLILFVTIPTVFASDNYVNYVAYSDKASTKSPVKQIQALEKEVKYLLKQQVAYTNNNDLESLKALYSSNYYNADGFNKDMYFDLVQKTWKLYPDIKYSMNIDTVSIIGNTAIALVSEVAEATPTEKVEDIDVKGHLKSNSECIYYLEKMGDTWLITSDSIISEKTSLTYGEANEISMELIVPQLIKADKEYTATLKINTSDKKMITIGSIGQEKITYPHVNADEVFRKVPESGILERVFKANNENLNEYTVASIGITRAKVNKNKEIKLVVTGLGYIITRSNIISTKDFSKVKEQNDKKETTAKLLD